MGTRPLVLVPGLGLGIEAWSPTLRRLRSDAPVRVMPLPGYGMPADRHVDLRPVALADRLHVELDPGSESPVLVGHSASCQVVAAAAVAAPERVAGLVLVGPTTDPRAATWKRLAARWLRTARHEDPRQVPTLARQYARTGLVTMARAMDAARRDRIEEALDRVTCPVLVLRGRHDRICPEDWATELAAGAGRRATTLPSGAHMVPLTHGDAVAGELDASVD